MNRKGKLCFVIMGFGKKTDPSSGRTLDLDKTYKNIIRPAVQKAGFRCVRADEVKDSSLIDTSMYALLMHADLVIADISTYNPNAIYELGVRHAVRPYSTIILKEETGSIPFDISHNRIFSYIHLGDDIGSDEAARCQMELVSKIESVNQSSIIDSPLYTFIKNVKPPKLTQEEYESIIGGLTETEDHVFAISEKASLCMNASNFEGATKLWEKAEELVPNEPYFIQQHALARYKSETPTKMSSLSDALQIIRKLDPDGETNDPETLGLTGAIYKRMWHLVKDVEYIKRAISYYGKGFKIRRDYYNGENYALCLNIAGSIEPNADEKIFYKISAKKAREEIISFLDYLNDDESRISVNKWAYATMASCHFGIDDDINGEKFEKVFFSLAVVGWEKETYLESKKQLLTLIKG